MKGTRLTVSLICIILTAGIGGALTLCYILRAVAAPPAHLVSLVAGAVLLMLFILLGAAFLPHWFQAWSGKTEDIQVNRGGKRTNRPFSLHPAGRILAALLLSRVVLFILAYALDTRLNGYSGTLWTRLDLWSPSSFDARHYLYLAEHGYTNVGDERFLLVFFPFYPFVVRLLIPLLRDYLLSGLFVSNLAVILSGLIFYELALQDMDRYTARRSLKYLCILPAAFLLSAPLSDSLFLLLTVSAMYLARKKAYAPACLLAGLSAYTRLMGIVLFAPICFELVVDLINQRRNPAVHRIDITQNIGSCLSLLLVPLGLGLFLSLNQRVTGSAWQFLTYQRENWQQQPGWFFSTAQYQMDNLLSALQEGNLPYALGLWLPNLVFLFGALVVMIPAAKKLRPSYIAYFIAYYVVSMGATWLLSAPRYLCALFPLPLALGALTEQKWMDALATLICLVGYVAYLAAFVLQWHVY